MIAAIPAIWPDWAALKRQAVAVMDIILHIGAHRTATTTFQDYMRSNATGLALRNIGFWGPRRTRKGLFAGLFPAPRAANGRNRERRAIGRVKMQCLRAQNHGYGHLVISDENMIGSVCSNLQDGSLYHGAGERMARYAQVFQGRRIKVFMSIRAQDSYWASALGYGLTRGYPVPGRDLIGALAHGARRWRDVITDIACAVPDADITILPFESFGGRPDAQLALMTGIAAPRGHARQCLNPTPHLPELRDFLDLRGEHSTLLPGTGRWLPFDPDQVTAMREAYLDDLFWLHAGAEGLATIIEENSADRTGNNPAAAPNARGHPNGYEKRTMV